MQEPVLDFFGLGDGKNAAGCSEGVTRKARMDFGEALEGLPGWGFADGDVRIIWNERLSMGGIDDAHGEAGAEERKEDSDFLFVQRKRLVIGGEDSAGGGKRMFLAEDSIGGGDGGLGYREADVHIAEVDDAENAAGLRPGRRYEGVMVVGVSVNDAAAEIRKLWDGFALEKSEELFGESALFWIADVGKIIASLERAGEIPFEFA